MKDGNYICHVYIGNTGIYIYGYDHQIEYAYIGDENITEMLMSLNVWDKVVEAAYAVRPWEFAV